MAAAHWPDPGEGHGGNTPLSSPHHVQASPLHPCSSTSLGTLGAGLLGVSLEMSVPSSSGKAPGSFPVLCPQNVRVLGQAENKVALQKELAFLELLNTLFRSIRQGVRTPRPQPSAPERSGQGSEGEVPDAQWGVSSLGVVQEP